MALNRCFPVFQFFLATEPRGFPKPGLEGIPSLIQREVIPSALSPTAPGVVRLRRATVLPRQGGQWHMLSPSGSCSLRATCEPPALLAGDNLYVLGSCRGCTLQQTCTSPIGLALQHSGVVPRSTKVPYPGIPRPQTMV